MVTTRSIEPLARSKGGVWRCCGKVESAWEEAVLAARGATTTLDGGQIIVERCFGGEENVVQ